MALFNRLTPYSNLHDINLDWIISIIKSIDPAVIKALQNLTPEFIKQINNKVNEAQIAATSAQRSASEANTAKESAAASADRATTAMTAVESSLLPVDLQIVPTANIAQTTSQQVRRSGNVVTIAITGQFSTEGASSDYWTTLYTIPGVSLPSDATVVFFVNDTGTIDGSISPSGDLRIVSSVITGAEKFFKISASIITN